MIKIRSRDKNVEVLLVMSLHIPQQKQRRLLTLFLTLLTCEEQWVVKTHCFKKKDTFNISGSKVIMWIS